MPLDLSVTAEPTDARAAPRLSLPVRYTLARMRLITGQDAAGLIHARFPLLGYVHDISAVGMKFELPEPLNVGDRIEARVTLPGQTTDAIELTGTIVRMHGEAGVGPARMAMAFDEPHTALGDALADYLGRRLARAA